MKKNLFIAAMAATALIACKNVDTEDEMMDDVGMENEMEMDETMNPKNNTTVVYTQTDAVNFQRDFEESVEVSNGKATNVKGWMLYNNVNNDIITLRKATPANRMTASQKLRADFNDLRNSIPEYMNVRRVRKAIDDVDEEITDFEKDAAKAGVTEKTMTENLDAIGEAYDDLAEEIAKAREQYIDNKADAMEEYLEEINDLDKNKTTSERYRDGIEEYNEEMDQN
jgi:archaellum component FlaC